MRVLIAAFRRNRGDVVVSGDRIEPFDGCFLKRNASMACVAERLVTSLPRNSNRLDTWPRPAKFDARQESLCLSIVVLPSGQGFCLTGPVDAVWIVAEEFCAAEAAAGAARPDADASAAGGRGVVKVARLNLFVAVPAMPDLAALNAYLMGRCRSDLNRRVRGQTAPKKRVLIDDRAAFRPLPETRFDACNPKAGQADSESLVRFDKNDTHPPAVIEPLLEDLFGKLPSGIHRVLVRADGAFYDHEIIEFIEKRRAFYVIVARLTRPLQNRLGGLRYRRISRGVWGTQFQYCPQGWTGPRRFVVVRRPIPKEPSAQLHLFQMGSYTYQVFVTNLALTPLNLWRFYNRRATAELIIRELKEAYALGKIPTRDFAANECFFQIALLAYNLLNWFKRLCVPPRWQRTTLQGLRQRLLVVLAQLVRPASVPTLRLARGYVYTYDFLNILKRIRHLRPLLNTPEATRRRHSQRQCAKKHSIRR